jgi:hypothetical protein
MSFVLLVFVQSLSWQMIGAFVWTRKRREQNARFAFLACDRASWVWWPGKFSCTRVGLVSKTALRGKNGASGEGGGLKRVRPWVIACPSALPSGSTVAMSLSDHSPQRGAR